MEKKEMHVVYLTRSLSIDPKQAYYICNIPRSLNHERKQPHIYLVYSITRSLSHGSA